jgi:hypothetical protein
MIITLCHSPQVTYDKIFVYLQREVCLEEGLEESLRPTAQDYRDENNNSPEKVVGDRDDGKECHGKRALVESRYVQAKIALCIVIVTKVVFAHDFVRLIIHLRLARRSIRGFFRRKPLHVLYILESERQAIIPNRRKRG